MAVLGVSNERLEAAVHDAIAAGVKALTIFASGYLDNDPAPKLTARISAMAREAGIQICGGNCMGFYNLSYGLRVCGFPPPQWMRKGGAVLLTHSGSVYSGICHNDKRMGWALAVSAGQELTTTVADYLDFALEMPETRCIGLFLETVRDPQNFVARPGEGARARHPGDRAQGRQDGGLCREGGQPFRRHRRQPRRLCRLVRPAQRDRGRDAGRLRQRAAVLLRAAPAGAGRHRDHA